MPTKSRLDIDLYIAVRGEVRDGMFHGNAYDRLYQGMGDIVHTNTYEAVDDRVDQAMRIHFRRTRELRDIE